MRFTVIRLNDKVRLYQLRYPIYSPNIICSTSIHNEYTVYKRSAEDDSVFELLSIRFDTRLYHLFSLQEDCPGIDHIGIIHFLSGLFTEAKIPILYVNTYSSNLIFIGEEYMNDALELMSQNKRIILE